MRTHDKSRRWSTPVFLKFYHGGRKPRRKTYSYLDAVTAFQSVTGRTVISKANLVPSTAVPPVGGLSCDPAYAFWSGSSILVIGKTQWQRRIAISPIRERTVPNFAMSQSRPSCLDASCSELTEPLRSLLFWVRLGPIPSISPGSELTSHSFSQVLARTTVCGRLVPKMLRDLLPLDRLVPIILLVARLPPDRVPQALPDELDLAAWQSCPLSGVVEGEGETESKARRRARLAGGKTNFPAFVSWKTKGLLFSVTCHSRGCWRWGEVAW